ncbi:MAG: VWA domain-containing protein [Spirochaetia bacterium]|nr:VWA domain-containing protein [Spirochaetia bacterium]
MAQRKSAAFGKALLPVLPFLALAAYLADLPLPVPRPFLPERRYLALDASFAPRLAELARAERGARVSLPDAAIRLPEPDAAEALAALAERLPARGSLAGALGDLGPSRFPARVVVAGDFLPTAAERTALEEASRAAGSTFRFERLEPAAPRPFMALGREAGGRHASYEVELALGPGAAAFARLRASQGGLLLAEAAGPARPADGVLRFVAAAGGEPIVLEASGDGGSFRIEVAAGRTEAESARVLVVTERPELSGALEALYRTDRVLPEELGGVDLSRYELIALDGVGPRSLPPGGADALAEALEGRSASLLAVADSAGFGAAADDSGRLEALLPVISRPRSLERLPELAVLVMLDVSGSMFGDKLSLAKVSGVELLRNLKARDLVGLLLFSDRRTWVYDFAPGEETRAARELEPVAAEGGTDLAAALEEGLDSLAALDAPGTGRHVVVVSDGITKPADFATLVERAVAEGVTISTMAIGDEADSALLASIAARSGGRAWRVEGPDEIPAVLFRDRAAISRAGFLDERTEIFALDGTALAVVDGMAQYTAKEEAQVLLSNRFGDPFLASVERGARGSIFLASDLYGSMTAEFWGSPRAAGVVAARLDAAFAERLASARVVEDERGLTALVRGELLVAPELEVSGPEGWKERVRAERVAPGLFAARVEAPWAGEYVALVRDGGEVAGRFALHASGGFSGASAEAERAAPRKESFFALPRNRGAWLLAFFGLSLASSVALRQRRR